MQHKCPFIHSWSIRQLIITALICRRLRRRPVFFLCPFHVYSRLFDAQISGLRAKCIAPNRNKLSRREMSVSWCVQPVPICRIKARLPPKLTVTFASLRTLFSDAAVGWADAVCTDDDAAMNTVHANWLARCNQPPEKCECRSSTFYAYDYTWAFDIFIQFFSAITQLNICRLLQLWFDLSLAGKH